MSDEIEISEYLRLVRKHWIWAFISFVIVFGAVVAYTLMTPPTYESKSLISINGQDQANFLFGSSAPKVTDIETQKVVIQSSNVMYAIYSRHDYSTFSYSVNTLKNTNIIEIDVQSKDPMNAATIANDIAATYTKYTAEERMKEAENNIGVITDMLTQYDTDISALNAQAARYKMLGATLNKSDMIAYQNVQKDIIAKNKIYDDLLAKREEATLTSDLNNTNVRIIEYANVPQTPIKPNVQLNIILGFILGLGAALASVMFANTFTEKKQPIKKF